MHTISPLSFLLIAVVFLVLFGRGKVSALMGDLGQGIKAFKSGIQDEDKSAKETALIRDNKDANPS